MLSSHSKQIEDNKVVVIFKRAVQDLKKTLSVLRHELGHVLGFRHEHVWEHLTEETEEDCTLLGDAVDENSIMHYQKIWNDFAKNVVTDLSDKDKELSKKFYTDN
eukprot:EC825693.1.p1 GENE.EC825693.1~~EC825693.1.p1  ORF type:complete len:105 (+),score=28.93 EC825693.1:184-498(+)